MKKSDNFADKHRDDSFMVLKHVKKHELPQYIIVGGVNTVFGYGFFVFFLFVNFHYSLAVLFATILGVLFNFQTYDKLVFRRYPKGRLLHFSLVYAVVYSINVLLLSLVDSVIDDLYISGAIVILPIALLGYVLNKRFIWKKKS